MATESRDERRTRAERVPDRRDLDRLQTALRRRIAADRPWRAGRSLRLDWPRAKRHRPAAGFHRAADNADRGRAAAAGTGGVRSAPFHSEMNFTSLQTLQPSR